MGLKIEINGGQMKVNGQEVDLTNPEVAKKYGISGQITAMSKEESEELREELARAKAEREAALARAKAEREATLAKAKIERERLRTETDTNQRKDDKKKKSGQNSTIFGISAEELTNNDSLNLGSNVHIRMEDVRIDDTYVSDFEYGGNESNQDIQQATEEDFDYLSIFDDDDFEIGTENYEKAYKETIPQQKGIFAKLKELMHNIFRDGER